LPDGRFIEYINDARGRRVGKLVDGLLSRQYVWRGQLQIVAELDGAGNLINRNLFALGTNSPDLIERDGDVYRVVKDRLGSPRLVVNVTDPSDVLMSATYDEFGNVSGFGLDEIAFGFAGGLYDSDTGLVRFGARDYDPLVGRWTSKDPLLFGGQQSNLYVYVGNQPTNVTDPTGTIPWIEVLFPFLIPLDTAHWAGAIATLVNLVDPGANTALDWNGGDPVVVLENSAGSCGNAGLTLGHVVALRDTRSSATLTYAHELAHVQQHNILGPAYLPTHGLAQAYSFLASGSYDGSNPLETGPSSTPSQPWP
jgi:RHS repeat-associated protein